MLGGYISDLAAGDVFEPVEYVLTAFMASEYAHGVEEGWEGFQSSRAPGGRQIRTPTMIHVDKMRILEKNCLKERRVGGAKGPHARIHYEYFARHHSPAYVGERLVVSGRITDKYVKRGREYIDYYLEVRAADGRLVTTYTDKTLLRYEPEGGFRHPPAGRPEVGAPPSAPAGGRHSAVAAKAPRAPGDLEVGAEIHGPVRLMTTERIEWYDSAMLSAAQGTLAQVGSNIHTDEAYARSQGLSAIIADGMIMTNWVSSMLVDHFEMGYVERGELRTKFIKPVPLGMTVVCRGRVLAVEPIAGGRTAYRLDVWCEDEHGLKVVDGGARVEVPA
jgi:acyl dehydratase